jgi:hypothetical protein
MSVKENTRKCKSRKSLPLPIAAAFCFCLVLLFIGCQPNQAILDSQNKSRNTDVSTNSSAPPINAFESDVKSMQTANFDFIYVFRRKDGGKLTAEDKKFAKANAPFETNRFIVSDEERAIIAGSNTKFAPANLEALKSGFDVTDVSKPESETKNAGSNVNANK